MNVYKGFICGLHISSGLSPCQGSSGRAVIVWYPYHPLTGLPQVKMVSTSVPGPWFRGGR